MYEYFDDKYDSVVRHKTRAKDQERRRRAKCRASELKSTTMVNAIDGYVNALSYAVLSVVLLPLG